eukprot:337836-Amphidinium_carterae.1
MEIKGLDSLPDVVLCPESTIQTKLIDDDNNDDAGGDDDNGDDTDDDDDEDEDDLDDDDEDFCSQRVALRQTFHSKSKLLRFRPNLFTTTLCQKWHQHLSMFGNMKGHIGIG